MVYGLLTFVKKFNKSENIFFSNVKLFTSVKIKKKIILKIKYQSILKYGV